MGCKYLNVKHQCSCNLQVVKVKVIAGISVLEETVQVAIDGADL